MPSRAPLVALVLLLLSACAPFGFDADKDADPPPAVAEPVRHEEPVTEAPAAVEPAPLVVVAPELDAGTDAGGSGDAGEDASKEACLLIICVGR